MINLFSLDYLLLGLALLLLLSVIASKFSDRLGIPLLLIFIVIGMLTGSEGVGGIYFDDPALAQSLGFAALVVILFSGGLETEWKGIRPIIKEGVLLSTVGVVITTLITGAIAYYLFHMTLTYSLLLGAIVSSTDVAAVFGVLRSRNIHLNKNIKSLLEFESGSNDPMAVFLTIGLIGLIQNPNKPFLALLPDFVFQFLLGGMAGILIGKLTLFLINRLKLGYEGLYPVLALGMALMVYAVSNRLGGSGFLSVYIFGLWLGKEDFLHKKSLIRFYDGLAWLMQIIMFVTLGLLVFPSRVFPIILPGLLLAFGLIFIARPISVFLILPLFKRYRFRETMLVSWIGLRGAVPIILATFPLQYKLDGADLIFNIIFFVVLVSVLFQGTSIPYLVKLLRLEELMTPPDVSPIEISPGVILGRRFEEVAISPDSSAIKKAIYELQLPDEFLIILINRKGEYIIPSGSVILEPEDRILALSESNAFDQALDILEAKVTER